MQSVGVWLVHAVVKGMWDVQIIAGNLLGHEAIKLVSCCIQYGSKNYY